MTHDFDSQLLESVAVRRRRLRDALLHGSLRTRRSTEENFGKIFAGLALAAVLCAGCVGWSFISHRMAQRAPSGPVPTASSAGQTAGP